MINVGDQIQTRDKQQEQLLYTENEIEYAGYLSPLALKSLPVPLSLVIMIHQVVIIAFTLIIQMRQD